MDTASQLDCGWRHQAKLKIIQGDVLEHMVIKVPLRPLEKAVTVLSPNPPPQLEDKMAIIIMGHFKFNETYCLGRKWPNKKQVFCLLQ